jgi:hypothetical protein
MTYQRQNRCRSCGDAKLRAFLEMGPMPPANAFLRLAQDFSNERSYPLQVCLCPTCGLVQTPDVLDRETLFRSGPYLTGVSRSMRDHFRSSAKRIVEHLGLEPGEIVLEIGSNDGTLLECFREEGVEALGIEPARGAANASRTRGIETIERFFDETLASALRVERGGFRAVIANNVLAHVDHPVEFLRGCRSLVEGAGGGANGSGGGSVVFEVPWLGDLVDRRAYDTIYHEHLSYFSVTALERVVREAGLAIDLVEHVPVHGGSLRVWTSARTGARRHGDSSDSADSLSDWSTSERAMGLMDFDRLKRFAADVEENRRALVALLKGLKKEGARIAACGAPAKGSVLLNHARIGTGLVEFTVDANPLKVGSCVPGMHQPVLPTQALAERRPDYALLLAWNLIDEMKEEQAAWLAQGGRFIVPIPRPEILP